MLLDGRTMAVAKHADIGLLFLQPFERLIRKMASLIQYMPDRDGDSGSPDDAQAGQPALLKAIDVSRHGNDRRNPLELPDDSRAADVAGMKNGRHAGKVLDKRRIEQPVRVGNHTESHNAPATHGAAAG